VRIIALHRQRRTARAVSAVMSPSRSPRFPVRVLHGGPACRPIARRRGGWPVLITVPGPGGSVTGATIGAHGCRQGVRLPPTLLWLAGCFSAFANAIEFRSWIQSHL
jgi:hypothetical protein